MFKIMYNISICVPECVCVCVFTYIICITLIRVRFETNTLSCIIINYY
jgi:hypothetical protein